MYIIRLQSSMTMLGTLVGNSHIQTLDKFCHCYKIPERFYGFAVRGHLAQLIWF